MRTYTALLPDVETGTLDIDFVVHGDEGVAGPWAATRRDRRLLLANGPGGAYRPDPNADWHLLVGDESAVPAIAAALDALPDDAVARVVVLVDSAEHEPRPGAADRWTDHRSSTATAAPMACLRPPCVPWTGRAAACTPSCTARPRR